jgi:hypothetical protein
VERALTRVHAAVLGCLAMMGFGCALERAPSVVEPPRRFVFATDSFSFANESHWVYVDDPETGARVWAEQPVYFALHCAGVARAARQFLVHARFDPAAPPVDAATYHALAKAVLGRNPRVTRPAEPPIVIPGYADLRSFSAAHEAMLKDELLRDWRSVMPRGDWRIVVPYSPASQARTAEALYRAVRDGTPAIVRVFRFPVMALNHAVLLFDAEERDGDFEFRAYDPNDASGPITITFDRFGRTFMYPPRRYFDGGPIKVYEVYAGLLT